MPAAPIALFPEEPSAVLSISAADRAVAVHEAWIEERLKFGWSKVTVWEELPVTVTRSSFYRFLERQQAGPPG